MQIHLLDGTYELFRHHFGQPSRRAPDGTEIAATRGVVASVLAMFEGGVTHLGVATDHVIESFRNDLWPGYKTGAGMPPELLAQFPLLEEVLGALGVTVWPMVELEADDALASAARIAQADDRVDKIVICTPDKDLAQCVRGSRVVQLNRRTGVESDADAVREHFGVDPESIPDWLALVGDTADGFPGIAGWGKRSAAVALSLYKHLDEIPASADDWEPGTKKGVRGAADLARRLNAEIDRALLFRDLATLRIEPSVMANVDELCWRGPTPDFEAVCRRLGMSNLTDRAVQLASR